MQAGGGRDGNLIICGIVGAFHDSAGRTFANATNIQVPVKGFHPIDHHSCMHADVSCWKKYIEPSIKI